MKTKIVSISLLFLIGLSLGFLFTSQLKSKSSRLTNPAYSYGELKALIADFQKNQNMLKDEIKKVREEISQRQKDIQGSKSISATLLSQLNEQKQEAGLVPASGEGIIIKFSDGQKIKGSEEDRSIAHAADLRDIVNVLWLAGAKAISINDERIVWSTSIDCIINTILINNSHTTPPFEIKAIGDPTELKSFLTSNQYLEDLHERSKTGQVEFVVLGGKNLEIPAFEGSFDIKFSMVD